MGVKVHTYPVADLVEHILEGHTCPCQPEIEFFPAAYTNRRGDSWQYLHHALDVELDDDESRGWDNYIEPGNPKLPNWLARFFRKSDRVEIERR